MVTQGLWFPLCEERISIRKPEVSKLPALPPPCPGCQERDGRCIDGCIRKPEVIQIPDPT
jgi:hypothetical protein